MGWKERIDFKKVKEANLFRIYYPRRKTFKRNESIQNVSLAYGYIFNRNWSSQVAEVTFSFGSDVRFTYQVVFLFWLYQTEHRILEWLKWTQYLTSRTLFLGNHQVSTLTSVSYLYWNNPLPKERFKRVLKIVLIMIHLCNCALSNKYRGQNAQSLGFSF